MTENKTATMTTTTTTTNPTPAPPEKKIGYTSEQELLNEFIQYMKDPTNIETATNYVYHSLIEEVIFGIALEVHHTVRAGTSDAIEGQPEDMKPYSIIQHPNFDVLGTTTTKRTLDCNCHCPHCDKLVAALRFAPHLEKCMGMGRNSSRIASRRLASTRTGTTNFFTNSDDDDDVDWASEKRKRRNIQNVRSNGSRRNGKS